MTPFVKSVNQQTLVGILYISVCFSGWIFCRDFIILSKYFKNIQIFGSWNSRVWNKNLL